MTAARLVKLLLVLSSAAPAASFSPVFGILAQPDDHSKFTLIVSSYVKWLESAGARVVPIRYGAPDCHVSFLMERINGLVLPGGSAGTDPKEGYGKFAYSLYQKALGRKIPVWGTCLGHESIMRFTAYEAGEPSPIHHHPAEGVVLPLHFQHGAGSAGLYQSMPRPMRKSLSTQNLTINLHKFGISAELFRKSKALSGHFHLVATSVDSNGKEFVALTQHRTLPVYTSQFHSEKNPYEFQEGLYDGDDNAGSSSAHSVEGIEVAQWLANWLVSQAREGKYLWNKGELEDWIIYNWAPKFSHKTEGTQWEQQYTWSLDGSEPACPHATILL